MKPLGWEAKRLQEEKKQSPDAMIPQPGLAEEQLLHLGRGQDTCHFDGKEFQTRTHSCVTTLLTALANCWSQKCFSFDLFLPQWMMTDGWTPVFCLQPLTPCLGTHRGTAALRPPSSQLLLPGWTFAEGREVGLSAVHPAMVGLPEGQWWLHNWDENGAMGGCCTLFSGGWRRTERHGEHQLITIQQKEACLPPCLGLPLSKANGVLTL